MVAFLAAILAEAALLVYFTIRLYWVQRNAAEYSKTACSRYLRAKICLLPVLVLLFYTGFAASLCAMFGVEDEMWVSLYLCGFGTMAAVFAGTVVYILNDVQCFVKYGVTVDARVTDKSVKFGRNVLHLEYDVRGHGWPVQLFLPKDMEEPQVSDTVPVTYIKTMPFIVRFADNRATERRQIYEILFMTGCLLISLGIIVVQIFV